MAEEQRKRSGEQEFYGHKDGDPDRSRYEGFEGMNYEQRRQPYRDQDTSGSNPSDKSGNPAGNKEQA